jgi:hypothetical protein
MKNLIPIICPLIFLMAFSAATSAAGDKEIQEKDVYYGCGKPHSIAGYEITFQGEKISLPGYVVIKRGDQTIYTDPKVVGWEPPYTSARYAVINQMLLVLTQSSDCIDQTQQELFIIRKGENIVHQPVWTSNWDGGFFLDDGHLSYWSEWFCQPEDKTRKSGMSYIYRFSSNKEAFERIDVPEDKYCPNLAVSRFIIFRDIPEIAQ